VQKGKGEPESGRENRRAEGSHQPDEGLGLGAVVAALIVLACSRKQVERFVKTLQERALTASGPSEDRLRDQVRQARERQQREAERVQAEVSQCDVSPATRLVSARTE
jgi:hypothetical protein